jgi:uncharacterized protein
MKIEATVQEIRALLDLAELDARAPELAPESHESRREAARDRVPKPLLERYQRLFDIGRRPPTAAIEGGSCSGCHVRLPTMLEHKARRTPAIHDCPHCHRMLYSPELVSDATGRPLSGRRARADKAAAPPPEKLS